MTLRSDLISSAMLLTRLPIGRVLPGDPTPQAANAAWAWPLAGLAVGVPAGALGMGIAASGLPGGIAAALTLLCLVMLTGAMHEDGLADLADGFWGGFTPDRRLEIMRDSRIGAYGVIALILSLLGRWLLLEAALSQGNLFGATVVAAVVSRAPMGVVMRWLPPARNDGLSRTSGQPPKKAVRIAIAIAGVALLSQGLLHAVLAVALVAGVAWSLGLVARAKIGGQTGDVLGAVQQLCEIAVLAALVAR
ncbi:adenosylcobinamide-GDP ribazoletransferase [Jannaschia sp. 2305UL9-9]|uniref:adenosylcobinamide-GDP ribazoletransferase n=1 Tax=Jannaschia sp. 2305UL9-9 TaxID=3121638 RepID=UPI003526CC45